MIDKLAKAWLWFVAGLVATILFAMVVWVLIDGWPFSVIGIAFVLFVAVTGAAVVRLATKSIP